MKKLTKIFVLLLSVALVLGALMMVISADTEAEVVYKTAEEAVDSSSDGTYTDETAVTVAGYVVKVVRGETTTYGNVKFLEDLLGPFNNNVYSDQAAADAAVAAGDNVILPGDVITLLDNVAVTGFSAYQDAAFDKYNVGAYTFDLAGKSIKLLGGHLFLIDECTTDLTITSSKEGASIISESDMAIIASYRHGNKVTVSNITVEASKLISINTFGSYQNNATTVKFENCKLYQTGSANGFITMNDIMIGCKAANNTNPRKYVWGTMDFVGCTLSQEKYEGTGSLITPSNKRKVELDGGVMTVNLSGNTVVNVKEGNTAFDLNQYHVTVKISKSTVNGNVNAAYGIILLDRGAIVGGYTGEIKDIANYVSDDVTGASAGIYVTSGNKLAENGDVYTVVKDSAFATAEEETAIDFKENSTMTEAEALAAGYVVKVVKTDGETVTITYGNVKWLEAKLDTNSDNIKTTPEYVIENNETYYLLTSVAIPGITTNHANHANLDKPEGIGGNVTFDLNGYNLKITSGFFILVDQAANEGKIVHNIRITNSSETKSTLTSESSLPLVKVVRSGAGIPTFDGNIKVVCNRLYESSNFGSSQDTGAINILSGEYHLTGSALIYLTKGGNKGVYPKTSATIQNATITQGENNSESIINTNGSDSKGLVNVAFTNCTIVPNSATAFTLNKHAEVTLNNTTVEGQLDAGAGKIILGEGTKFNGTATDVKSNSEYVAGNITGKKSGIFYAAEDLTHSLIDKTTYMVAKNDYVFPTVATITFYHGKGFVNSTSTLCLINEVPTVPTTIVESYKDGDVIYKFAGWALEGSDQVVDSFAAITEGETTRAYYAVYVEYSDYAFTITNGEIVTTYDSEDELTTFLTTTDMLLDGDIITLNKNVTIAGQPDDKHTLSGSNKTVVFDLNGYTLNITDTLFALNSNTQNVTVKSSREGGVINHTGSNPLIFVKRNNHQVTIDGENITYYGHQLIWGRHYGVSNNGTGVVVNVNGGTYYQTRNSGTAFIHTYGYAHDGTTGHYYDGDINLDGVTIIQTSGVKYNEPIFSIEYHENFPVNSAINRYASKGYEVSNSVIKACTDKSIVHDMANINAHITYTNCEIYGNVGFVGHDNYASADGKTHGDVGTGIVVINGGFYTYCSTEIKAYDAAAITKYDGSASGVYYGAEGLASFMYNGGYKVCPEADTETIEIYWCDENGEEVFEEGIYYGGSDAFDEDGNYLGAPTSAIVPPVKVEGSVFGQMVHNGKWEYEADGNTLIAYAVMEEANSTQGAAPQYFVNAYLGTKLGVNFYIPAELTLISAYANGEEIQFSEDVCVIGGVEYRFVTAEVAANRVFTATDYEITFAEGEKEYTFEVGVSVIEYAKTILADTEGVYTNDEDKAMVTAMLEYLRVAHAIMGDVEIAYAEAYRQFNAIIGEKGEITVGEGTEYVANEVGLTISVNLASSPEYRIKITDAAITKVEVEMSGVKYEFLPKGLDEEGNEIETLTHSFNGTGRVSDFDDTVTVTIYKGEESVTITYTLDNYLYQLVHAEEIDVRYNETVTLLKAYIEAAKAYVA